MGLKFLEILEKSGKVKAVEKKILRDILEDVDGNPKEGDTLEMMKEELKKMNPWRIGRSEKHKSWKRKLFRADSGWRHTPDYGTNFEIEFRPISFC